MVAAQDAAIEKTVVARMTPTASISSHRAIARASRCSRRCRTRLAIAVFMPASERRSRSARIRAPFRIPSRLAIGRVIARCSPEATSR
jgi:hypothetical protein